MSRGKIKTIQYAFEYVFVYGFCLFAQLLPQKLKPSVGRILGTTFRLLTPKRVEIALTNLRRVFGSSTEEELRSIVKGVYRTLLANALDLVDPVGVVQRVHVGSHAQEMIDKFWNIYRQEHRALIFATGHIGNWEANGQFIGTYRPSTKFLAFPQSNPYVDRLINRYRLKRGGELIHSSEAPRKLPKVLRRGDWVYFVADQDGGKDGEIVDFLGTPASYNRGIGLFSYKYNAPIVVCATVWKGADYEFHVADIIEPNQSNEREAEVRRLVELYSFHLGQLVQRFPDQWLWTHRRWKSTMPY
jgi:KDO2-lipid IV(A) lauroyltransferase